MPANKPDSLTDAIRIGPTLPRTDAPLQPHERDERIAAPSPLQPVMIQAQRDVARGWRTPIAIRAWAS